MANIIPVGAGPTTIGPVNMSNKNGTVAIQLISPLGGTTGLNVKPQGRLSTAAGWSDIKMQDPASKTDVATLMAINQIGWFENIGYNDIQFVQTGAVGVNQAEVLISEGEDA